ncbi:alpha/beta-hydrolase [Nadsonia fulvescens var. elongata DSM 6958]|uniref:GPI inositol-deacylase n=1 Tax=Nadsonia fulvescens var. elongata DSM 6958 TaxID=857566 RepID=A0A1E3PLT6_9ASCO|nr:alpha/beta-hydrolase [Nadsonia fulvescens var. elongata DSM 6958]
MTFSFAIKRYPILSFSQVRCIRKTSFFGTHFYSTNPEPENRASSGHIPWNQDSHTEYKSETEPDKKRSEDYRIPENPIVLCHGLLGFEYLSTGIPAFPRIDYWQGVSELLEDRGAVTMLTHVPAVSSIKLRADALKLNIGQRIKEIQEISPEKFPPGKPKVNIIAHSMGGLDARYLVASLKPSEFDVASLTTICTPHRGSPFADYLINLIGGTGLTQYYEISKRVGLDDIKAFHQLTRAYTTKTFNVEVKNDPEVRYFSYGARFSPTPLNIFKWPHSVIQKKEGDNDGMVSVESAKWGEYLGTLEEADHLDVINWHYRLDRLLQLRKTKFDAKLLYLQLADKLAKEGL